MSNRNNFPHDNADDADESSDETEQNPATIGSICVVIMLVISAERPTPLSQLVVDQRTIDPHDWTNRQIDTLIQRPTDNYLEVAEPLAYCVILILLSWLIYFYWPLLVFTFFAYRWFIDNHQPALSSHESQSQYSTSLFNQAFDPYRDAQEEGRTASPTHEEIQLSSTVENLAPYGVQAALTTNLVPPANLDNIERTNINPVIRNEVAAQRMTNAPELINRHEQTSQTSPVVENLLNPIQHNAGINRTNLVNGQLEGADQGFAHNEATEIEGDVHAPADGARHALIPTVRFRSNTIPKLENSACPNDATHDRNSL